MRNTVKINPVPADNEPFNIAMKVIIIITNINKITLLIFKNNPSSRDETFVKEGKNKNTSWQMVIRSY